MLDFRELSQDGQDLELLIRELLFSKGYRVFWSGRGADGGRDLVCEEPYESIFAPHTKRWLLQCKHNAHGGKSVSINDLDNIVDSCTHHRADGYVLVCSTQPSSTVVQRLEGITADSRNPFLATFWDGVQIERLLSSPRSWHVAQRFFPVTADQWRIYATEESNHWIVNFRGFYFHLSNRIGTSREHHLASISEKLDVICYAPLPEDHLIRVRSIYYNDKSGEYVWSIDYMIPDDSNNEISDAELIGVLDDGWNDTQGQHHFFDIRKLKYSPFNDHFDVDHPEYYAHRGTGS